VLTTEVGEDVLQSRVEATRKALEQYLTEAMQRSNQVFDCSSCSGGSPSNTEWGNDSGAGVVVSGKNHEQLTSDCFFQALARYAFERSDWREIDMPSSVGDPWGDLTLAYLKDMGVGEKFRVARHPQLSRNGCEVLRFSYDAKPVSVVAGLKGPELWHTGLKDLWLDACRCEGVDGAIEVLPRVRFRSPQAPGSLRFEAMERFERMLGVHLTIVPLHRPELDFIKGLVFAHGYLSPAAGRRSRNVDKPVEAVTPP
jgi:hypothetical protein